jgi:hypothetical protein
MRFFSPLCGPAALWTSTGHSPAKEPVMAKGQAKSNKETRKPKKEKAPKANASNPSTKTQTVGLVTIKG